MVTDKHGTGLLYQTYKSSKDLHGPNVAVYKETLNQLSDLGGRGGCIVQGAILMMPI